MNSPSPSRPAASNFRWIICALLFFATTFNYLDRQVISYLKEFFCTPAEKGGFGWSNTDFANLTSFFTAFYAGMTIIAGWVIDKIGTKMGLALSLIVWSVFGICNAFVGRLVMMHVLIRSAFGVGEAGNFPASIKTVAEWFPKRERALATGIFNSGSNFGAMVAALFVPWCMIYFGDQLGWKMAFIFTGAAGFIWLIFWFWLYDTPAKSKRLVPGGIRSHPQRQGRSCEWRNEWRQVSKSSFGKLFSCHRPGAARQFLGHHAVDRHFDGVRFVDDHPDCGSQRENLRLRRNRAADRGKSFCHAQFRDGHSRVPHRCGCWSWRGCASPCKSNAGMTSAKPAGSCSSISCRASAV